MSAPTTGIRLIVKRGTQKRNVDIATDATVDEALAACVKALETKPAKKSAPAPE